jgi:hypothetical protein
MQVNPFSYLFSPISTANNANSASSVQQQADVLSTSTNAQFLTELQQIQSPQQFQAMLSNATGQPQPPVSSGAPVSDHHCQGRNSGTSPSSRASQSSAVQPAPMSAIQAQIANLFQPAQSPAL